MGATYSHLVMWAFFSQFAAQYCAAQTPVGLNNSPQLVTNWVKTTAGCTVDSPPGTEDGLIKATWSGACVKGYGHGKGALSIQTKIETLTFRGSLVKGRYSAGVVSRRITPQDGRVVILICDTKTEGICDGETTLISPEKTFRGVVSGVPSIGWGEIEFLESKEKYKGEVKNFVEHGKGEASLGKKSYKGEYKDGVIDGYGEFREGETKYLGYFRNGKYDGSGVLLVGLRSWKGVFKEGILNGTGEYADETVTYKGQFAGGRYHGRGTLCYENGISCFEGVYVEGRANGKGRFISDGEVLEATLKDDVIIDSKPYSWEANPAHHALCAKNFWIGTQNYFECKKIILTEQLRILKKMREEARARIASLSNSSNAESGMDRAMKCLSMAGRTTSNMLRGNEGNYFADVGRCSSDPDKFEKYQYERDRLEAQRARELQDSNEGMATGGAFNGAILPGRDGGMIHGGPLSGTILPGREGGMVVGGPLSGTIWPGKSGGMIHGGPMSGSIVPGAAGGMIIGGPMSGTILPPR